MKKKKIFIFFSAIATGIAIFFGRKRRQSKSASEEGEWTADGAGPDEAGEAGEGAEASSGSASASDSDDETGGDADDSAANPSPS